MSKCTCKKGVAKKCSDCKPAKKGTGMKATSRKLKGTGMSATSRKLKRKPTGTGMKATSRPLVRKINKKY